MCDENATTAENLIEQAALLLDAAASNLRKINDDITGHGSQFYVNQAIEYTKVTALIGIGNALTAHAIAAKQQADHYADDEEEQQNDLSRIVSQHRVARGGPVL